MNKDFKKDLESIVPLQGMEYEIIGSKGEFLYGYFDKKIVSIPVKLKNGPEFDKSNSTIIIKYIPVINNKKTKGMVILKYELKTSAKNPKFNWLVRFLEVFVMLSPYIYIIIFTIIFGAKFNKKLKIPLNELIKGAEKIKNKDLEFEIDYDSKDELGMLCKSFEEMRSELKKSLEHQ